MKGGSRQQAEDLRAKNEDQYKKKHEAMREAAEKRRIELEQLQEAERKNK